MLLDSNASATLTRGRVAHQFAISGQHGLRAVRLRPLSDDRSPTCPRTTHYSRDAVRRDGRPATVGLAICSANGAFVLARRPVAARSEPAPGIAPRNAAGVLRIRRLLADPRRA